MIEDKHSDLTLRSQMNNSDLKSESHIADLQ